MNAYDQGYEDYYNGIDRCPFDIGTSDWFDWKEGHLAAEVEADDFRDDQC